MSRFYVYYLTGTKKTGISSFVAIYWFRMESKMNEASLFFVVFPIQSEKRSEVLRAHLSSN